MCVRLTYNLTTDLVKKQLHAKRSYTILFLYAPTICNFSNICRRECEMRYNKLHVYVISSPTNRYYSRKIRFLNNFHFFFYSIFNVGRTICTRSRFFFLLSLVVESELTIFILLRPTNHTYAKTVPEVVVIVVYEIRLTQRLYLPTRHRHEQLRV